MWIPLLLACVLPSPGPPALPHLPPRPVPQQQGSRDARNQAERKAAAEHIESARAGLKEALAGKDGKAKLAAIQAVVKLSDAGIAKLLLGALDEKDPAVRAAALEALRWNDDPSVVPALHRLLETDRKLTRDPTLSTLLIKAIGQHADPSSVAVLAKNPFKTSNSEATKARIRSLGRIRTRGSVEALIGLLRGTSKKTLSHYREEFRLSLLVLTGTDLGTEASAWIRWWNDGGKNAEVTPEPGPLPRHIANRWYGYWGLRPPDRGVDRREERGRSRDR